MQRGIWNIPIPKEREVLMPDAVIVPLVGFDETQVSSGLWRRLFRPHACRGCAAPLCDRAGLRGCSVADDLSPGARHSDGSDRDRLSFCDRVPPAAVIRRSGSRVPPLQMEQQERYAVTRLSSRQFWVLAILWGGVSAGAVARADAVSAVQLLREGGCGGILPAARPLHRNARVDRAAEQWAAGRGPAAAAERSGYRRRERRPSLHVSGAESAAVDLIKRSGCRTVTDQKLRDIGIYRRGTETWLVLASPYAIPARRAGAAPGEARARTRQRRACSRNSLRRALVCAGAACETVRNTRERRVRACRRHGQARLF